jgi:hypothetical protein
MLAECTKKLFSVGVIKRTNSRKELLSITINTMCICIIYFRSNHLNFSILIRETSALYVACEAMAIIAVTKGVGEEEGVDEEEGTGNKVIASLISLSFSSLRLIQCIFDR